MSKQRLEQEPFQDLLIPPELEENLYRHRQHLHQLVMTLRSAGISPNEIEDNVSAIADSYKAELIRTIKELSKWR